MTTWHKTAGDLHDYIDVTIESLEDLDAVSALTAIVWRGSEAVALTATVEDSTARIVRVQLDGWLNLITDIRAQQFWALETKLTFLDGSYLTWPDEADDTIVVDPSAPSPA